jgi:hypothetical protein
LPFGVEGVGGARLLLMRERFADPNQVNDKRIAAIDARSRRSGCVRARD